MVNVLIGKVKLHESNAEQPKVLSRAEMGKKRNDKLAWRFFYHDVVKRKRYEDALNSLSDEFFLSPITIATYLLKNELISNILHNRPDLSQVQEHSFPFVFDISHSEQLKYNEYKKKS